MKRYFVYVLASSDKGRIYIGQTANLPDRLRVHNAGFCKSTKPFRPWVVRYSEKFRSRSRAVIRERYLKSGAGRKFLEETVGV